MSLQSSLIRFASGKMESWLTSGGSESCHKRTSESMRFKHTLVQNTRWNERILHLQICTLCYAICFDKNKNTTHEKNYIMFEEWFWPLTNQFDHNVQHVLNACFLLDIETGRTSWNDVNRLKTREGASRPHVTALAKELRQKEAKRLGPLAQPRRCNSSRYCMQGMSLWVCVLKFDCLSTNTSCVHVHSVYI